MKSFCGIVILLALFSPAHAGTIGTGTFGGYSFVDGGQFDGDGAGGNATFTAGGMTIVLSTHGVGDLLDTGTATLDEFDGFIGVNGGLGTPDQFDIGESWTFSFDTAGYFTGIDFGEFDMDQDDQFTLTSASGSLGITFDANAGDRFDGTGSFGTIHIAADEEITLAFSADAGAATLEGFRFTAVPEPASAVVLLMCVSGTVLQRRRTHWM